MARSQFTGSDFFAKLVSTMGRMVRLVRSFALKLFRLIRVHVTTRAARDREREALIRKTNKSSVLRTLDVCDIGFLCIRRSCIG